MKELLIFIVKNLVDNKDEVYVDEISKDNEIIFEVRVAKDDMGKVIGKQGRIAKAIRTVIKASNQDSNKKVIVDIIG